MTEAITWTNDRRKLRDLAPWEHNPRQIRKDEAERLAESLAEFGQIQTIAVDPDGSILDGHQRQLVWSASRQYGPDYEVDVRVASRPLSERERQKLVVYLHKGTAAGWDWEELANSFEVADLLDWGFDEGELQLDWGEDDLLGVDKDAKPNPRNLPIDVIYTLQMADCTCCLAVQAGLKYGIQSASYRLCPYTGQLSGRHAVAFIDNDYSEYDHAVHLASVRELRPKHATVRDYMSREQCAAAGIAFYELAQILDWAAELEQYAEHVIVIPKVDVLDQVPDKYVLGYSVPTSHGGTPLPLELFRGRRVHLLGGSWKAQLAHMAQLGDDVVSLDTNYVQRQAKMLGAACTPDGDEFQMQDVGYAYLTNVRYAALALSFGAIGAKVNELLYITGSRS